MNNDLLKRHIEKYGLDSKREPEKHEQGWRKRQDRRGAFQREIQDQAGVYIK